MNKEEFLQILQKRLSFLNPKEVKVHLDFYEEMINDRIDEGMNEFEAVKDLGAISDIVTLIKEGYGNKVEVENVVTEQVNINTTTNQNPKNDNYIIFIIIAICSFPIWFPLIVTIFCLLLALVIISITFIITGVGMLFSTFTILSSPIGTILLNIGLSFLLISLGLLLIPACNYSFKFIKDCCIKSTNYIKEKI
ncbi:MAG: DUF1700 domain-containing protein [bacterium]